MRINVKCFALARELAGAESVTVELPAGATVAQLKSELARHWPPLEPVLASSMMAVDGDYVSSDFALAEEQEVACIPPVSGG